jgi:hypothetical protein
MTMKPATSLTTLAACAIAATQLGATDCGVIISDAGFDHWCGDKLCFWDLERGQIRQVPTWHAGDDGVELVGADVAISQMTRVTSDDTECQHFEMIADIAPDAEVHLEADVFDDGTVDFRERIPTAAWRRVVVRVGIAGSYEGVRFRVTKAGPGRAVLARIHAEVADGGCPSLVPVTRPLGARCTTGDDCVSGVCTPDWLAGVCSTCASGADCDDGEVCGRADDVPGHLADWHTCLPAASRALGEPCFADGECASGACDGTLCGECNDQVACQDGACEPASPEVPVLVCAGPARAAGAACVIGDQCASGRCDGVALGTCGSSYFDACFEDDDCPGDTRSPGTCSFVAVAGGTCQ